MTSLIDQTGLVIEPNAEIVTDLVAAFQAIYGADINVDSNSPDGQLIQILAQADTDFLELLLATYNLFAVPTSYGVRLDQLVALNGIFRKQGTYTYPGVNVVVTLALTLPGVLDQSAVPPFTVSDNAGNQFELLDSHVFSAPGNATLTFRAVNLGQIETTPNTITNIITSTLGVQSVNNPDTTGDQIGVNEESDAQLKVRHDQSFNLAETGPSDAMEAALKNIADVVDAYVVENNTSGPVGGVPAYTVWPIVNGGTNIEIAQAIYSKKGPGAPLKGSVTQIVMRPNGTTFTAAWDIAVSQPLYIAFSVIWRGAQVLANADIETQLAAALSYKLGERPNIGDVLTAMATIAPTAIVTIDSSTQGVSVDNSAWESLVAPTNAYNYFTVSAGNITVS